MKTKTIVSILLCSFLVCGCHRVERVNLHPNSTEAVTEEDATAESTYEDAEDTSEDTGNEELCWYPSYQEACEAAGIPEDLPETAGILSMDSYAAVKGNYVEVVYRANGTGDLVVREGSEPACGIQNCDLASVSSYIDQDHECQIQTALNEDGQPTGFSLIKEDKAFLIMPGDGESLDQSTSGLLIEQILPK